MAIIEPLVRYVESELGTTLRLVVRLDDSLGVEGSFMVPAVGFLGGYIQSYVEYALQGDITILGQGKGCALTGEYLHVDGTCLVDTFGTAGKFEMKWDQGCFRGWWASEPSKQHEWIWIPKFGTLAAIQSWVGSKAMVRYTIFWCWAFLVITISQLVIVITTAGEAGIMASQIFNVIYALAYLTFFVAYGFMRRMPAKAYSAAIAVYTVGYAIFGWRATALLSEVTASPENLYMAGAALFLIGSVGLVLATIPRESKSWSALHHDASLFWGSIAFLLGSMAFSGDAVLFILGQPYNQVLSIVGYSIFVVGRAYYLWGSTTSDVGLFMRSPRRRRLSRRITRSTTELSYVQSGAKLHADPLVESSDGGNNV